jgi:hypothetical protein
LVYHP